MKSFILVSFIFFSVAHSSLAQNKTSIIDLLSSPFGSGNLSWIKNAAFKIDNKQATYKDTDTIEVSKVGKIELHTKKQAIAQFGKDEGNKGMVVIETIKLAKRTDVITINDSVTYFIENADTVFTSTEAKGAFIGGNPLWIKFLQKNLNADIPVENGAPPGIYKAIIAFTINADGTLTDAKIAYDAGYGTGKESLRIIQKSNSLWQPSQHEGKAVKSILMQSITFQISEG